MQAEQDSNKGSSCHGRFAKYCVDGKPLSRELLKLREDDPTDHPSTCNTPNPSVICMPASEPGIDMPLDLSLQYVQSSSPAFSYDFDGLVSGLQVELMAFDLVLALQNGADYAKPTYRQLKSVLPLTALEISFSSALQTVQDLDNDLRFPQRMTRSGLVGLEAGITDLISDGYGAAGFTRAGPYGYAVAAYATSVTMDNNWDNLNTKVFPALHLGDYP